MPLLLLHLSTVSMARHFHSESPGLMLTQEPGLDSSKWIFGTEAAENFRRAVRSFKSKMKKAVGTRSLPCSG